MTDHRMSESRTEITEQRKNRRTAGVLRHILLIILGVLLGVCLYFVNAQGILGNQLPMPFGYGIANVLSGSMEPTFSTGSLLVIKETDNVQKGDIVVYQSEGDLIVHRVIEINGDHVITQGDANNTPDPEIQKDRICGKAIFWIPYLGSLLNMIKTPAGILVLLVLAVLLVEGPFHRQKEQDEIQLDAIRDEIRRLKQENSPDTGKEAEQYERKQE